jgi:TonB family protein
VSRAIPWVLAGTIACGGSAPGSNDAADAAAEEPPVALNAEPSVQYPPTLYDQGVEGDVELRLFVDSSGRLSPESTKVSESSGYAALDTAAVRGVARLRYAPARRHGVPIATSFLQTVEFRHPGAAAPPARPVTRRDSTPAVPRVRADSSRARSDTARPPASPPPPSTPTDTTKSKPDTSGAAS